MMFKKIGERSQRNMVIDAIGPRDPDTLITYDELTDLLGRDKTTCQAIVNQAKAGLEKEHQKALVAVRNEGYRIVNAGEHLGLAQGHQKRSVRQLRKARSKVVNVDLGALTPGERTAVTLAATTLAAHLDYARRNDLRVSRLEVAQEVTRSEQDRSGAEIAQLHERLSRLEGLVS